MVNMVNTFKDIHMEVKCLQVVMERDIDNHTHNNNDRLNDLGTIHQYKLAMKDIEDRLAAIDDVEAKAASKFCEGCRRNVKTAIYNSVLTEPTAAETWAQLLKHSNRFLRYLEDAIARISSAYTVF